VSGAARASGTSARPPRITGRTCRLCGEPIPWKTKVSHARNLERKFCGHGHQAEWSRREGEKRRAAVALTDPARAASLERDAERNRWKKEMRYAARADREAREAARGTPQPPPPPGPERTELVLRLAAAGEHESGMRCAGLTPAEIGLALRIQRNGGRVES
jgi:hypothetical protein